MKVSLSFNLPEEREEHNLAMNGGKYHYVIWELLQEHLRRKLKYESDNLSEDYRKALEDTREFVVNCLADQDVSGDF